MWRRSVCEVVVVVDQLDQAGTLAQRRLDDLLGQIARFVPDLRVVEVPQSVTERDALFRRWSSSPGTVKDARGGPQLSYLVGLDSVRTEYVLHTDCDMLFGGHEAGWTTLAAEVLDRDETTVICDPWPGPPRPDLSLRVNRLRLLRTGLAGRVSFHMSTRCFFADMRKLRRLLVPLELAMPTAPKLSRLTQRTWHGGHLFEDFVTGAMVRSGTTRLSLLGASTDRGRWSLHPVERCDAYRAALRGLVASVERDAIPDAQRGEYDIIPAMLEQGAAWS
jgi:hypothetical protein